MEVVFDWIPFLNPGDTSSPLNTRGTSTFNKASEGALMKVTLSIASVAAFIWICSAQRKSFQKISPQTRTSMVH